MGLWGVPIVGLSMFVPSNNVHPGVFPAYTMVFSLQFL